MIQGRNAIEFGLRMEEIISWICIEIGQRGSSIVGSSWWRRRSFSLVFLEGRVFAR